MLQSHVGATGCGVRIYSILQPTRAPDGLRRGIVAGVELVPISTFGRLSRTWVGITIANGHAQELQAANPRGGTRRYLPYRYTSLTLSHALPLASSFLKTFLTVLISTSRMSVEEHTLWTSAFPGRQMGGRRGTGRRSKQVQVLLVWPSTPTKPGRLPDSSARAAVLTRSALAVPVRPNPASPCHNPPHLLREAMKNDALLFASYDLCQKRSLDSLKKNNPFQTIKIPTLRPSNIPVQQLKAPSLSLSFPGAE